MSNIKRKMGRPPIVGEPMDQISIRLTVKDIKKIDAIADKRGANRNETVRLLIAIGMMHWRGE